MNKSELIDGILNYETREAACKALRKKFKIEFKSSWNVFAGSFGGVVFSQKSGEKITKKQLVWLDAYLSGVMWSSNRSCELHKMKTLAVGDLYIETGL